MCLPTLPTRCIATQHPCRARFISRNKGSRLCLSRMSQAGHRNAPARKYFQPPVEDVSRVTRKRKNKADNSETTDQNSRRGARLGNEKPKQYGRSTRRRTYRSIAPTCRIDYVCAGVASIPATATLTTLTAMGKNHTRHLALGGKQHHCSMVNELGCLLQRVPGNACRSKACNYRTCSVFDRVSKTDAHQLARLMLHTAGSRRRNSLPKPTSQSS